MTTKQAIKYFKTAAGLAEALDIKAASISQWGLYPPIRRQYEIQEITKGKLVVSKSHAA